MLRPLHDRIIVKRFAEDHVSPGGIIIPDTAKEKPVEGKVISVGNGKRLEDGKQVALDIKTGDVVLFGKYSGVEIKIDGKDHIVLREDDVIGVLES